MCKHRLGSYIALPETANHFAPLRFLLLETILETLKSKFPKHKADATVLCEIKCKHFLYKNWSWQVMAQHLVIRVLRCWEEPTAGTGWRTFLTRGLDFIDILQKILSLVDDVESQIIHCQGFICMVLQALLGDGQVLCIKVIHLLGKLIIPRLEVGDDLRERSIYANQGLQHRPPHLTVSEPTV